MSPPRMRIFLIAAAALLLLAAWPSRQDGRAQASPSSKLVQLDFRDADILSVLDFYSQLLGKNFVPGAEVQGSVTVISNKPVTVGEAKLLLFSVLDLRGYSVVEMNGYYKVMRKGAAAHDGLRMNWEAGSDRMFTDVIQLKHVQASDIAPDIRRLLSPEADIFASKQMNYLVITDTGANIDKVHRLIQKIDQPGVGPDSRTWHLEYTKAEDMALVLTKAFPDDPQKNVRVLVSAMKDTNNLVITALPETLERIDKVIKTMDVRTRQVSISAMLVEVTLDNENKLGMEWQKYLALGAGWHGSVAQDFGNLQNMPGNTLVPNSENALKVSLLHRDDLGILMRALATDSKVRVVSSPHIMAMNNQKATISVGQQIPILKESRLDNNNQPIKTYDHMKFGMELDITPAIASNRDVTLQVSQTLSNLLNTDNADPDQWKSADRSASTTVVVKDGYSLVIGGLISDDSSWSNTGVPGLKNLPGVGFLFGQNQDKKVKTELLLFLTPAVVETPDEHVRLTQAQKEMNPDLIDTVGVEFDL